MSDIEKEPTESQKKKFENLEVYGDAEIEEFSGIEEKLAPDEKVEVLATIETDKKDRKLITLTNNRLITFNNPKKVKLLGNQERFRDLRLEDIQDVTVEERKGFDIIKIKTEKKERKLMAPENSGLKISGKIRQIQNQQSNKIDPAEQLEKIGEQKDKGNLTEEEFQEKKDDLIDRI